MSHLVLCDHLTACWSPLSAGPIAVLSMAATHMLITRGKPTHLATACRQGVSCFILHSFLSWCFLGFLTASPRFGSLPKMACEYYSSLGHLIWFEPLPFKRPKIHHSFPVTLRMFIGYLSIHPCIQPSSCCFSWSGSQERHGAYPRQCRAQDCGYTLDRMPVDNRAHRIIHYGQFIDAS